MRTICLLVFLGILEIPCRAQSEGEVIEKNPAIRVSAGAAIGLAVSGRPQETMGTPVAGLFVVPIELRKH